MSRPKKVLITGGAGFLGSSLAHALAAQGCREICAVDNFHPGLGGHPENLAEISKICPDFRLERLDLRALGDWRALLAGVDLVLHCAGNGDHGASMRDPLLDLELNTMLSLQLLEACRSAAPKATVVLLGTRAEYGPVECLPVGEAQATRPLGCYAVSKLATTHYGRVYAEHFGLHTICLRLTNIYGPRAQIRHPGYLVANWFLREALQGHELQVFGDGQIRRDYVYVDDAVAGILALAAAPRGATCGQVFNLGGMETHSLLELAEACIAASGSGSLRRVPAPGQRAQLEPGDYQGDSRRMRAVCGWSAKVGLMAGLAKTVDYYRPRLATYLSAA